jgi:hypothetical protein
LRRKKMKKAIILLFSFSLLVLATPINDVNSQTTSVNVAKADSKAVADPIYPPIG